jgi:hypothetical protein
MIKDAFLEDEALKSILKWHRIKMGSKTGIRD